MLEANVKGDCLHTRWPCVALYSRNVLGVKLKDVGIMWMIQRHDQTKPRQVTVISRAVETQSFDEDHLVAGP